MPGNSWNKLGVPSCQLILHRLTALRPCPSGSEDRKRGQEDCLCTICKVYSPLLNIVGKTSTQELRRRISSKEHLLLLQGTQVQFPAPIWCGWQAYVVIVPRVLTAFSELCGHMATHRDKQTCRYSHKQKINFKIVFIHCRYSIICWINESSHW